MLAPGTYTWRIAATSSTSLIVPVTITISSRKESFLIRLSPSITLSIIALSIAHLLILTNSSDQKWIRVGVHRAGLYTWSSVSSC